MTQTESGETGHAEELIPSYDPYPDAIDYQIGLGESWGLANLEPEALCNPTGVHLLMHLWNVSLREQKRAQNERDRYREESVNLRDRLTRSEERDKFIWLEIFASALLGYATNLLTTSSWAIGVVLLVLSLFGLLVLRGADLLKVFVRVRGTLRPKRKEDAHD